MDMKRASASFLIAAFFGISTYAQTLCDRNDLICGNNNTTNQKAGNADIRCSLSEECEYVPRQSGWMQSELAKSGAQNNNLTPQGNASSSVQFRGPNPYFDASTYGSRGVAVGGSGSNVSGIASCTIGSPTILLPKAYSFVNGDGVAIYGCGPAPAVSTLSAPTVTTGNSKNMQTPNAALTAATGGSTYRYKLVAVDSMKGIALPSSATTIANGLPLGQQTAKVSEWSLTGNTLTLTFSFAPNVADGAKMSFHDSSNAFVSGTYTLSGGGGTTTLNFAQVAPYSATTIRGTGGKALWYNANNLRFPAEANLHQAIICAQRPGDSSYHIIGITHPADLNNNDPDALSFNDWGSPYTTSPSFPTYFSDSICTTSSTTPEILSSIIISGAGTTTLTIANRAGKTNSGQNIYQDNAPNLKLADAAAAAVKGTLVIPYNTTIQIYAPITFNSHLLIQGNISATETLTFNNNVEGTMVVQGGQFYWVGTSYIHCSGAWPCVIQAGRATMIKNLTLYANGGNQALIMLRGSPGGYQVLDHVQCSTGTMLDYTGVCDYVAPATGGFNYPRHYVAFIGGPNQKNDASWAPIADSEGSSSATDIFEYWDHLNLAGRGVYVNMNNAWPAYIKFNNFYQQGTTMPTFSFENVPGLYMSCEGNINDTGVQPIYAVWGNTNTHITCKQLQTTSQESGGFPLPYTGNQGAIPEVDIAGLPTDNNITPYGSGINRSEVWSAHGIFGAFSTLTNCTSSTSPAVCATAPEGAAVIATGETSVVVNTTAVTANSNISLTFDSSLSSRLGVSCNKIFSQPYVTARIAGTSFSVTVGSAPSSNPLCFTYRIGN